VQVRCHAHTVGPPPAHAAKVTLTARACTHEDTRERHSRERHMQRAHPLRDTYLHTLSQRTSFVCRECNVEGSVDETAVYCCTEGYAIILTIHSPEATFFTLARRQAPPPPISHSCAYDICEGCLCDHSSGAGRDERRAEEVDEEAKAALRQQQEDAMHTPEATATR
jgi:hypothetical protein